MLATFYFEEKAMNIILLSGGSGTRLWPLSNEVRSKQFLKILTKEDGTKENMVQRVYRMIKDINNDASITFATSQNQVSQIKTYLGDKVDISVEPCRMDTFPAIILACCYLRKKGVPIDENIIVSPVDHFVDKEYYGLLKKMDEMIGDTNLTLIGIKPTYPSEKFGYITKDLKFVEKPSEKDAQHLIEDGACWNGGVFGFKLSYMIEKAKELTGYSTYDDIVKNYNKLNKISFDYAVAEKEKSISFIQYDGMWKDLGTWNTLTEAMSEQACGNVIFNNCENTHIVNELSIPFVALGLKNTVIAATPDGILVSDKLESSRLKLYVKKDRPMSETRQWGEYKVLDYKVLKNGNNSLTKELIIHDGKNISYQHHEHRSEIWTIIDGEGILVLNDKKSNVKYGDTITIKPFEKHAIKAIKELHIIEVQVGDELTEEDIYRYDYKWED